VEHFQWPLIFYINIPIGVIATLLTLAFVKSPKYGEKSSPSDVDWLGIALLAISVGSLQYVLEKGQEEDWFSSKTILVLAIVAFFGFFFFLWRELTFRNPVVELRVLKNGNLRVGTILSFIMGFGLYGSTFIIPLYTQTTLGWTAQQSGMLMVPAALTTAFMMPFIGQMMQRGIPHQYMVSAGMFTFFVFTFWGYKIMTPDTAEGDFFWMLIVRGVGMGLLFMPITMLSLSTLKGKQIGQGAAFTGMMRQLGGSFGIALITTFMSSQVVRHSSTLASHIQQNDPVAAGRVAGIAHRFAFDGIPPNIALQDAYKAIYYMIAKQAAVLSYMDVFLYLGVLFLLCIPFILLARSNRKKKGEKSGKIDMSEAMH
jgi:DHA2 family multidrug resistance protein